MTPTSPPVATWELGLRLREIRERGDMHPADAAKTIGITQNYLSNVEHGRRTIAEDKLTKLLDTYSLVQEERDELIALRKGSDRRGWWSRYNGVLPPDLLNLFSYQHGANEIRSYESGIVSGLLQTEDYARAIHAGDRANLRVSDVDRRVEARMRNQERLTGAEPLNAVILMAEATLRQQVGGKKVLSDQLEHLLVLMDRWSNLDLRIIPFSAESYGAMGSSTFHLLTFPSTRLRRLAWHETITSLHLISDNARIHQYNLSFSEAMDRSVDHEASKQVISEAQRAII